MDVFTSFTTLGGDMGVAGHLGQSLLIIHLANYHGRIPDEIVLYSCHLLQKSLKYRRHSRSMGVFLCDG
jgi:hypothetical protein